MQKLLRLVLNLAAIYLTIDGAIHLLNIRLISVVGIWPQFAISYATLLNTIYASFVFLAAAISFIIQKDVKKYQALILLSGIWALIHGFLLIFLSLTQNFTQNLSSMPSLVVWIPFYDQYLLFESALAIAYAVIVFIWFKKK